MYAVRPGFSQVLFLFRPMILLLTKAVQIFGCNWGCRYLAVIGAAVGKL